MYYSEAELKELGLKAYGTNVKISNKSSLYNPANISLGSNVRIDDFCILSAGSGGIDIGNNVHVACYCSLIGDAKITLEDFVGISSRTAVYSSTDDYSGEFLTGPTVPKKYLNIISKEVILKKHVIIGSGSVILPGVVLEEGVAAGALSLITKSFESFVIITGTPAKILKNRSRGLKTLEADYLK